MCEQKFWKLNDFILHAHIFFVQVNKLSKSYWSKTCPTVAVVEAFGRLSGAPQVLIKGYIPSTINTKMNLVFLLSLGRLGGRHLVDIIVHFLWTLLSMRIVIFLGEFSCTFFGWILVDILGEFSWTFDSNDIIKQ